MSISPGLAAWKLAFQLSPIILTNGLVDAFPGGMLPIIAITEAINFPLGLLSGGENIELDGFFANFEPVVGGSIVQQDIAVVPFANQAVAANATIAQPLDVSMRMIVPAKNRLGYYAKLGIMMALQASLEQHNSLGGTYTVVTPSFIYTNCILRSLRDAASGATQQPQNAWQFDFVRPLITLEDAQSAQNSLFNMLSRQTRINGVPAFSGLGTMVGQPGSVTGQSIIPSLTGATGGGTIAVGPTVPGV